MPRYAIALLFVFIGSIVQADDLRSVFGVDVANIADLIGEHRDVELAAGGKVTLPTKKGVIITRVWDRSPAKDVLEGLDIIDRIGRTPVDDVEQFQRVVSALPAGETVRVSIRRAELTRKDGKVVGFYKRSTVRIKPESLRSLIMAQVEESEIPGSDKVRVEHRDAPSFQGPSGFDVFFNANGTGDILPYLNIRYSGDDWLFVERATINIDGVETNIDTPRSLRSSEVVFGDGVREWWVLPCDGIVLEVVQKLREAEHVAVTYHGQSYYKTFELENDDLLRIQQTMQAAELRGWKPPK